jgi:hypothetical protein
MNTQTQLPPAPPPPPSRKVGRRAGRFWPRVGLIGVALLSLLVGVGIGYSATPTDKLESDLASARADLAEAQEAVEESQDLQEHATGEASDARAERDAAMADLASAEQTIEELHRRVRELQRDLRGEKRRLEKLTNKAAPGARETMGDGTWRVGEEVVPGTYRSPGGGNCYWERLSNFSGDLGGIIANGFADRNPTVAIASSDAGFSTDGCGTWTRIG